jgi:EPS-associated MarR family transcriptional regulator
MTEHTVPAAATTFAHGDAEGAGLAVLRLLEQRPEMSQRELSDALGLSLGRTHFVLHALLDKGLVKARNFRRSGNKLAYAYVLTPSGMREKLRLTRAFLSRKEAEFEAMRQMIQKRQHMMLVKDAKGNVTGLITIEDINSELLGYDFEQSI